MTTYVLEMRSTARWDDVRYREYTCSARKAELFKSVPKIQFTDSGHGIVPHVHEHRGRKESPIRALWEHVHDHITAKGREVRSAEPRCPKGMKPVYVKQWRTIIFVPEAVIERAKAALQLSPQGNVHE